MKKIFLVLLSFIHLICAWSQQREKDSLKHLLQIEKTDTGRVIRLADLSFLYFESKPDTAMTIALEALVLATKINFTKGKAISLNRVGNAYDVLGNYPKAMEVLLQALPINEKINNTDGIRRNYNNIGNLYIEQDDYRMGLDYYLKAKWLVEKTDDKQSFSITYGNLAEAYHLLKMFDSAKLYAQMANAIATSINYPRMIGSSYSRMGSIYAETGQNTLAHDFYRLGIPFLIKSGNDVKLTQTFLEMAKLFESIQQNDSALFYARQSLVLARERRFTREVRDAGRFLSSYFRKQNNPDSAFAYLDITKMANDSIFSQQKQRQLQSLVFDEKLRELEKAGSEAKTKEERNNNLQYAAIALGLLTFLILFLLYSHSIIANQKLIRFLGIISLLLVFEFINLFIHPYLSHATNNSPLIMLLVMVCIAGLLVPLHHRMEKWISHRLVEKNKKIRLAAAKKTIAALETDPIT